MLAMLRTRRGFTLVEILVVVTIIGILAAITYANFSDSRDQARIAKATEELKNIELAFDLFYQTYGRLPDSCSLCGYRTYCAPGSPAGCPTYGWGPNSWQAVVNTFATQLPSAVIPLEDPWGRFYAHDNNYLVPNQALPSILCSLGPDGILQTWNSAVSSSLTDRTADGDDICIFLEEPDDT